MKYRLEVRLTAGDVGKRVVIRWRRPAADGGEEIADVIGVLEAADAICFKIRKASGELVAISRERALAGKAVPPAPRRDRRLLALRVLRVGAPDDPVQGGDMVSVGGSPGIGEAEPDPLPCVADGRDLAPREGRAPRDLAPREGRAPRDLAPREGRGV